VPATEDIPAESNFDLNKSKETKPDDANPYGDDKPAAPMQKPKDEKKNLDLLKSPATKPQKPKAVLPPKGR
jgi:hypothetical protein